MPTELSSQRSAAETPEFHVERLFPRSPICKLNKTKYDTGGKRAELGVYGRAVSLTQTFPTYPRHSPCPVGLAAGAGPGAAL